MTFKGTLYALILTLSVVSLNVYAEVNDAAIKVKWGYKDDIGPMRWGKLDPLFATCSKGHDQSPINIMKKVFPAENTLKINYLPAPLAIVNDGVTTLQLGSEQVMINDGHSIQANFPAPSNETITFKGNTYRLVQFHIHTPSENAWNGQIYPLEIDFVHQGDNGQVLVIAVFANSGKDNAELQKIVNHMPSDKGIEHVIAGESIDPSAFFTMPLAGYYSVSGSLTVPPCTEGIQWIIMANPSIVSLPQITKLKSAIGGANARPAQPLNGRVISVSK